MPRRTPFSGFCLLAVAALLPALAGCLSSPPPGRVSVSGVVKVKGVPIPDGQIDFEAADPASGIGGGVVRIGAGGRFQLYLRPGDYRVGIVSVEGGLTPAGLSGEGASKIRVPPKYAVPARSGVEAKIDAKNRRVVLDLQ